MSASHGSTPAAWTGVVISLIGFTIAGIGSVIPSWTWFWVGVALQPVAAVLAYLMGSKTRRDFA